MEAFSQEQLRNLEIIKHEVKKRMLETVQSNTGHIGGPLSSLEMMLVLYFGGVLKFDPSNPYNPNRDRVLMRGHLGPLRYPIFSLLNWISKEELKTFHKINSRLQGHEDMRICPGVDMTPSGSLGMLLSYGAGISVALKKVNSEGKVWVFLGDGEEQEGMVQEAVRHIPLLELNNLICVIDKNTKQLSMPVEWTDNTNLNGWWQSAGWDVIEIADGHDFNQVISSFQIAKTNNRPTVVISNTVKGNGIKDASSHFSGYHTSSVCPKEYLSEAIALIPEVDNTKLLKAIDEQLKLTELPNPVNLFSSNAFPVVSIDNYHRGFEKEVKVAEIFMECCRSVIMQLNASSIRVYAMTADLIKPSQIKEFGFTESNVLFFNCGLREQHMVGLAHGIANTDSHCKVIIHYGDAFVNRIADMLNAMSQVRTPNVVFLGTNGGLSAALNGSTHQSASQPAMLQFMYGMRFFEPGDPNDSIRCFVEAINSQDGPQYIRFHGLPMKPIYSDLQTYKPWRFLNFSDKPRVILIGCGLSVNGVNTAVKFSHFREFVTVIDIIEPSNLSGLGEVLPDAVPILTFYNGSPEILGAWVSLELMRNSGRSYGKISTFGFGIGTSGYLEELISHYGLDSAGVINAILSITG